MGLSWSSSFPWVLYRVAWCDLWYPGVYAIFGCHLPAWRHGISSRHCLLDKSPAGLPRCRDGHLQIISLVAIPVNFCLWISGSMSLVWDVRWQPACLPQGRWVSVTVDTQQYVWHGAMRRPLIRRLDTWPWSGILTVTKSVTMMKRWFSKSKGNVACACMVSWNAVCVLAHTLCCEIHVYSCSILIESKHIISLFYGIAGCHNHPSHNII